MRVHTRDSRTRALCRYRNAMPMRSFVQPSKPFGDKSLSSSALTLSLLTRSLVRLFAFVPLSGEERRERREASPDTYIQDGLLCAREATLQSTCNGTTSLTLFSERILICCNKIKNIRKKPPPYQWNTNSANIKLDKNSVGNNMSKLNFFSNFYGILFSPISKND